MIATGSADFYGRFAPRADLEPLVAAICWVYWGFAFDDAVCDEGPVSVRPAEFCARAAGVQRALETPGKRCFRDRYAAAMNDLGQMFRALASPVAVRRFVQAHRAWLWGVHWQISNRALGLMPSLDDYLTMRLHSAGGEPTFALLEIANAIEVPAREMYSPRVLALTEMAILVAALDNDRHSFARERQRNQTDQNIFTVLCHQGLPADRAVAEAVRLRDRVLCRFLRVRDRMGPASTELRHYLEDLGHGIVGNAIWGQRAARYRSLAKGHGVQGPTGVTHALIWTESPLDSADAPPIGVPSIGWWWEV
ncbi:hypothetical protein GCM10023321_32290 [Pseudonocardia eucalypti]|uniref:Terpene synthase n=2 Tax=Pseudonocardia eucalypti TaxID=648755 RepID=A0ABP9Q838_9PSEU